MFIQRYRWQYVHLEVWLCLIEAKIEEEEEEEEMFIKSK